MLSTSGSLSTRKCACIYVYVHASLHIRNAFILYIYKYIYKPSHINICVYICMYYIYVCVFVNAYAEAFGYNSVILYHRVTTSGEYFGIVK